MTYVYYNDGYRLLVVTFSKGANVSNGGNGIK